MAALPPASRRLCLVVDVERYSRFRNPQAYEAQRRVLWSMWHACRAAGVNPRACDQQDRGDGLRIELSLTQAELGALASVAESTAEAILAGWRRDGVIGTGYRRVVVRDMRALEALGGPGEVP